MWNEGNWNAIGDEIRRAVVGQWQYGGVIRQFLSRTCSRTPDATATIEKIEESAETKFPTYGDLYKIYSNARVHGRTCEYDVAEGTTIDQG